MKLLVQRVKYASVTVDNKKVGNIRKRVIGIFGCNSHR